LCPRERAIQKLTLGEFDVASPLLPRNTQLNIMLKQRKNVTNWHGYLLPENLNATSGSLASQLTEEQWNTARQFTARVPTEDASDAVKTYNILSVAITLSDVYLEVNINKTHANIIFSCKNHATSSDYYYFYW
jgi:hypothetical protein